MKFREFLTLTVYLKFFVSYVSNQIVYSDSICGL